LPPWVVWEVNGKVPLMVSQRFEPNVVEQVYSQT
jgi:hypothetical protein